MTAATTQPIDLAQVRAARRLTWKARGASGKLEGGEPMTAVEAEAAIRRNWTVVHLVWVGPDRCAVTVSSPTVERGVRKERLFDFRGTPAVLDPHAVITEFEQRLTTGQLDQDEAARIVAALRAHADGSHAQAIEALDGLMSAAAR